MTDVSILTQPTPRLRVERAVVFIDESGRFQPAIPGLPPERPLIVSVLFKDVDVNRARIAAAVARLRVRRGPKFKAADLDEADYASICDLVRCCGYIGWNGVEYSHGDDHPAECARMLDALARMLEESGSRTSRDLHVLAALDRTRQQLAHAGSPNLAAYVVQLVYRLRRTAEWFRSEGIVPDLRVTLDERLRPDDVDLVRFLPRLAVSTVFPEFFETRLSALWAGDDQNTAVVSTDDVCDGLVLADAIAYAQGRIQRRLDPEGFYARQMARCVRGRD